MFPLINDLPITIPDTPEYTCKHPIFPHHNTVDLMYDALNNGCEQKDWYAYLDFISNNQYEFQ